MFHPDTVRYITQLASGRPSYVHQKRIDELVLGLKQDNNWNLFDRFWILAQPVQPLSRVSLVNPTSVNMTEVNSPTWTANQGYTGNGVDMYLNTNFNPNTQGVNFTLNSATLGFYSRTDIIETTYNLSCIVTGIPNNFCGMSIKRVGNLMFNDINNDSATSIDFTGATTGLFTASRTAAELTTSYRNGISIGTTAVISSSIPSLNLFAMASNNSGVPSVFSTRQMSMAFAGGGGIDSLKLFLRIERYLDQLSSGVI